MGRLGGTLLRVSTPDGAPVQVTAGGGASSVSVDDQELTGIAGGTVLTPPGWATATSRIDLDATSGFSQLTVSRWSPAGS
jgi:hypothetical protein